MNEIEIEKAYDIQNLRLIQVAEGQNRYNLSRIKGYIEDMARLNRNMKLPSKTPIMKGGSKIQGRLKNRHQKRRSSLNLTYDVEL
mmetsp:Transcript_26880/g.34899  ORF Transcript_26880/g.34899 Transcript_26880/m.34899 type:complete len:85 (-) Transcript_26880:163-417(-)